MTKSVGEEISTAPDKPFHDTNARQNRLCRPRKGELQRKSWWGALGGGRDEHTKTIDPKDLREIPPSISKNGVAFGQVRKPRCHETLIDTEEGTPAGSVVDPKTDRLRFCAAAVSGCRFNVRRSAVLRQVREMVRNIPTRCDVDATAACPFNRYGAVYETVEPRVFAMMGHVVSEGRLLALKPSEWAMLLVGVSLCGFAVLLF